MVIVRMLLTVVNIHDRLTYYHALSPLTSANSTCYNCPRHELIAGVNARMSIDLQFTPERIKRIREGLGLNGKEFAEKAGVSAPAVSLWENGLRRPAGHEILARLLELEREAEEAAV